LTVGILRHPYKPCQVIFSILQRIIDHKTLQELNAGACVYASA
jgi:hypothetical protein